MQEEVCFDRVTIQVFKRNIKATGSFEDRWFFIWKGGEKDEKRRIASQDVHGFLGNGTVVRESFG